MSERVRQSVIIGGINNAEPCHTVEDGKMTDLSNLRYKNGAFCNVFEPEMIFPVINSNGFEIIYKMECIPYNEYLAIRNNEVHMIAILDGSISSKQLISRLAFSCEKIKLHHFGSVLYVNYEDSMLQEECYIYKNGRFSGFNLRDLKPAEIAVDCEYLLAPDIGERPKPEFTNELINGTLILKCDMKESAESSYYAQKSFEYNISRQYLQGKGYVVGDFQIMVAYRLFDGTLIKPSRAHYISSFRNIQDNNTLQKAKFHGSGNDTFEVFYYDKIYGVKPTVRLLSNVLLNDIVTEIVILSTREELMYDYDSIHEKYGENGDKIELPFPPLGYGGELTLVATKRTLIYDKNKNLSEVPYYEIERFASNETNKSLNYDDHYRHIETNDIYTASYSLHDVISRGKYEYNNRLHAFDIRLDLFKGYNFVAGSGITGSYFGPDIAITNTLSTMNIDTELLIDNKSQIVTNSVTAWFFRSQSTERIFVAVSNLVQYPDSRATKMRIWGGNGVVGYSHEIKLEKSAANNIAWAFIKKDVSSQSFVHDYVLIDAYPFSGTPSPSSIPKSIIQPNKLYVSALNNPFFTDPKNIYTIGGITSAIDCINTATEQITETKFGVFPLYVFSDMAIYALEIGSGEVLYQSVIGVSNETKLINTTTVGAGNLVFFISKRGVMAMEGRNVFCISKPLDQYAGLDQTTDSFYTYSMSAELIYNSIENELLVYNGNYEYAYIYSLDAKIWSRRDWKSLNIGSCSQIYIRDKGVASAWNEDRTMPLLYCGMESRAIKLGSLDFKRVETFVARLKCGGNSHYEIKLFGSNDLLHWCALSYISDQPLIRRTDASYKYFKVIIECAVRDYFTITNFDAEYYHRFLRKLR